MLYGDFIDDVDMYVRFAKKHNEILLCGTGTGRITFPIAKEGVRVLALDISKPMLDRLKSKLNKLPNDIQENVIIIKDDMRHFTLDKVFSCCIVPFSTFNYLITTDDQVNALISIRKHLKDGGDLILELLSANTFPELMNGCGKIKSFEKQFENKRIEMWRTTRFNSATQIITQEREYITYYSDGRQEQSTLLWRNKFFFLSEIVLLLEKCGFEVSDLFGDYQLGPYNNDSEFIVVKALAK